MAIKRYSIFPISWLSIISVACGVLVLRRDDVGVFNSPSRQGKWILYIYIYIYMCVCACVCVEHNYIK